MGLPTFPSFGISAAGTILANLVTDAFRKATKADIGFTANGMMRSPLTRGKSGVQTVYDVFAVAPLADGIADTTAGSALVTAYFTGQELKNLLEFCLLDNPTHPGEYFPRASGMRFHCDSSRPQFDVVTAIEIGYLDRGYRAIDITGNPAPFCRCGGPHVAHEKREERGSFRDAHPVLPPKAQPLLSNSRSPQL